MIGEPIGGKLVDALEDGGYLIESDNLYEFKKLGKRRTIAAMWSFVPDRDTFQPAD